MKRWLIAHILACKVYPNEKEAGSTYRDRVVFELGVYDGRRQESKAGLRQPCDISDGEYETWRTGYSVTAGY